MRRGSAILFVCLVLTGCSAAARPDAPGRPPPPLAARQTKSLYPVTLDGRYGFIDRTGKLVIRLPPEVYNTRPYSEGMAVIGVRVPNTHGRWGFIDEAGQVVIRPQFRRAMRFSEGLAAVVMSDDEETIGQLGYVDKTGAVVIKPQFAVSTDGDFAFSQGLAAVETRTGKWGYIDKTGAMLVKAQFDSAGSFAEGLAAVGIRETPYTLDHRVGYIDLKGNWVVRPRFSRGDNFSEGLAAVEEEGKLGYINRKGEMVIKPQFGDGRPCMEELGFERREDFSEGLAAVSVGDKWGYIDQTGRFVIEPRFDCAQRFSEGLAATGMRTPSGEIRIGYIDRAGKPVIEARFRGARGFSGGLALVAVGGPDVESPEKALREGEKEQSARAFEKMLEENEEKFGYIDRSGKYVWPPTAEPR